MVEEGTKKEEKRNRVRVREQKSTQSAGERYGWIRETGIVW